MIGRIACGTWVAGRTKRSRVVEGATSGAPVDQVAPNAARGLAVGVEPRVQGLEVEPLEGSELGANDQRVVLATTGLERGVAPVGSGELVLDDDPGEVGSDVRCECRDR